MKNRFNIQDNNLKVQQNLDLKIDINLNMLTLTLQSKNKDMRLYHEYSDTFEITTETDMDDLIFKFYEKYLQLKSVEIYWTNHFSQNNKVIEIPKID